MNFLRDPVWQSIGVIIAIDALLLTILLYKRQVRRKEILWDLVENVSLSSFNVSESVKSALVYKTLRLDDVNLFYVNVWNSGNIEILPNDFHDPIKFDFGNKAQVLEVVLLDAKPKNIAEKISFSIEANYVKLLPLLLNSGDLIKLKVLVTKFSGNVSDVKVDARIAGIKQIYRSTENEPYLTIMGSAFLKMLLSIIGFFAGGALLFLLIGLFFYLVGETVTGYLYYELLILPLASFPALIMRYFIKQKIGKRVLRFKEKALYLIPPIALFVLIFVLFNLLLIHSIRPIHLTPIF